MLSQHFFHYRILLILMVLVGVAIFLSVEQAQAQDNSHIIVVAQNDPQPGFWNRVFNRSGSHSKKKPLFLDQPGSSQTKATKPYDYNKNIRSVVSTKTFTNEDGQKIIQQRDAIILQKKQAALQYAALQNEQNAVRSQQAIKSHSVNSTETPKKQMVYDLKKIKKSNSQPAPEVVEPSEHQPRLYNRRN